MTAGADGPPQPPEVKVTIRKRPVEEAAGFVAGNYPARIEGAAIFVVEFSHVKPSLATFLKFWLMGGCGVEGWAGTGELEAEHSPSGTRATIEVDTERGTVSLSSQSAPSAEGNAQLSGYAVALLDELDALAKTEEAAPADRLCYPPEAVDAVRLAAWAALAPREPAESAPGGEPQPDGVGEPDGDADGELGDTPFAQFLRELK